MHTPPSVAERLAPLFDADARGWAFRGRKPEGVPRLRDSVETSCKGGGPGTNAKRAAVHGGPGSQTQIPSRTLETQPPILTRHAVRHGPAVPVERGLDRCAEKLADIGGRSAFRGFFSTPVDL